MRQIIDLSLKAAIRVMKSCPADCHIMGAQVARWARVHVNEKNRLTTFVYNDGAGKPRGGKEYRYREYHSGLDIMTSPDELCSFVDKVEGASEENKAAAKAEIRAHFFEADAIDLKVKK